MKKIVNANIGGVPFTLDDDAYALLTEYLNTLTALYHDEDADMVADIEARIAELLLSHVPEGRIVTLEDVRKEIDIIGDPREFGDEDIASDTIETDEKVVINETIETASVPPAMPAPAQVEHKLYRDPRNKMIAGVCSGIAAYNHLSVNLVRIITVAACFLTIVFPLGAALSVWIIPIVYACFWIAVPEAHTPLQYMELYGESGTMADVAKAVNSQYAYSTTPPPYYQTNKGFWATVGNIIMAIVKGFFAFLAVVIGVPALIGLIFVTIALIIVGIVEVCAQLAGNVDFATTFPYMAQIMDSVPINYGWMIFILIFTLGALLIPSWFLIRSVFGLEKRFPLSRRGRIIWLIIWILCILLTISGMAMVA